MRAFDWAIVLAYILWIVYDGLRRSKGSLLPEPRREFGIWHSAFGIVNSCHGFETNPGFLWRRSDLAAVGLHAASGDGPVAPAAVSREVPAA